MSTTIQLTFNGGARSVTGANFLLKNKDTKILVDCGMFQGKNVCEGRNDEPFPYDPKDIDFLFITHAHLDHVGRIPKLVQDGFRGRIISTPPTRDSAELILLDSIRVLQYEARKERREPLYSEKEVNEAMKLWEGVAYHENIPLPNDVKAFFKTTGHTLGSGMVVFERRGRSIVFTGDIGNSPAPLLPFTEYADGANYLVMESVYGDRLHEDRSLRKEKLRNEIEVTRKKNGVLLIPAFSLERTQELLFEIEEMVEGGEVEALPVFIDSPLAIKITEIYRRYKNYFNKNVQNLIQGGDTLFSFPKLSMTLHAKDSREIHKTPNPKIIIAGSGMSNGGRILNHEKRYLGDPSTTLLIMGFQAPGSLGRKLQEGEKKIVIDEEKITVRANVTSILGYSAHADRNALFSFVEKSHTSLEQVFLTMGEPRSAMSFSQLLHDELAVRTSIPEEGESVELIL
ncbi:MAG: MBL fold metallo-hydrolase [Candidatus Paceibacterota bacterium]